jgi:hypothetical protein
MRSGATLAPFRADRLFRKQDCSEGEWLAGPWDYSSRSGGRKRFWVLVWGVQVRGQIDNGKVNYYSSDAEAGFRLED